MKKVEDSFSMRPTEMVDLWSEPKKCWGHFQSTPEKNSKQRTELKTLYFLKGKEVKEMCIYD